MTELRTRDKLMIAFVRLIVIPVVVLGIMAFVTWEIFTGGFYTAPEPYRTIAALTPITFLVLFGIADHYWGLSESEGDKE